MGDFDPSVDPTAGSRYDGYGQVNPNDPSVANGQISLADWQAYQAKRKKDALLGVLGVLGMTTGLGALGAAGTAGSATATGSLGAIEGGAPWAVTPFASSASMVPTGAAAVGGSIGTGMTAAGTGALNTVVNQGGDAAKKFLGMDAKDLAALGLGLGGTIGGALSKKPDLAANTSTTDPQLQELLALMSGRLKKSEPLFDSVQAMANGLLPTQYQKGGGGMG